MVNQDWQPYVHSSDQETVCFLKITAFSVEGRFRKLTVFVVAIGRQLITSVLITNNLARTTQNEYFLWTDVVSD